ncbi:MAG: YafY family transcriptional regulator [Pedobacter sp.]|nr:MAG: YafY family transcriptional regulator [Pedobacter sp.]
MSTNDTKRLSRLVAILTLLQTKRLITAPELATKFMVSSRTIYRDIKALEQAGVPVIMVDGKGYTLMEGYRIPPVMFTERQANALILAEQLVVYKKDTLFINDYIEAIDKIKSVLKTTVKDKANLLSERTRIYRDRKDEIISTTLSDLQYCITNFNLAQIHYINERLEQSERTIEPFALLSTKENWLVVAWCQMRKEFRYFRLDRIKHLEILSEKFEPHNMTLQQYFDQYY